MSCSISLFSVYIKHNYIINVDNKQWPAPELRQFGGYFTNKLVVLGESMSVMLHTFQICLREVALIFFYFSSYVAGLYTLLDPGRGSEQAIKRRMGLVEQALIVQQGAPILIFEEGH